MNLGMSDGWLSVCWKDRRFLPIALCAVVVFLLDVVLPLGVASGVLHVTVVVFALRIAGGQFVMATAVFCSVLTLLDIFFSPGPGGTEWWKVIVNRGLSLLVIWVTAILGQQRNRAADAERRHLSDLAHLSRIKTAECLAGALAHELNQPLTAVSLHAEIAQQQLSQLRRAQSDSRTAPFLTHELVSDSSHSTSAELTANEWCLSSTLREISEQSLRASDILRSLRNHVRKTDSTRLPVSINELIEEPLRLIEAAAREARVELRCAVPQSLPSVCVDRIQIEQVILNLLQNGIDSLTREQQDGVKRVGQLEPSFVLISAKLTRSGWIQITVRDNGPGIDATMMDTIFQPFSTSKAHGLGLGLAFSRTIIEAHSGSLTLEHTISGATFHLELPTHVVSSQP